MRTIGQIPHSEFVITLFNWNSKYILKFETGPFEQTFKIAEMDVTGEQEIRDLVNNTKFMESVNSCFHSMSDNLYSVIE